MSRVISVSQFNTYVHNIFLSEELLLNIQLYGEVSGVSYSGNNVYFSIKDEGAVLNCVKFGLKDGEYMAKEGEMVLVRGSPNYYIKGGRFSFNVIKIEPYGKGLLYQQFLELKNKLESLGYFDQSRKKPLPKNIRRIGVVSSETGAVIQDIIDIAQRRNPLIDIVLYPAKVQGIGAENTIISGIEALDKTDVDVIIIARGGGSAEDLSTFNAESVALAIVAANKPIISAVGHETDFTIADFVADLRAPTPSAAAELVTIDLVKLFHEMQNYAQRLLRLFTNIFEVNKNQIDILYNQMLIAIKNSINEKIVDINSFNSRLVNSANIDIQNITHKFDLLSQRLENLNPVKIFRLGYAQIEKQGNILNSVENVSLGDDLTIHLLDGILETKVTKKQKGS